MLYWVFIEVGEGACQAIQDAAAGMLIVYFCVTGTGGMCR